MIHWQGEVGSSAFYLGDPVTDDKTQVTCEDCLRMIDFLESIER